MNAIPYAILPRDPAPADSDSNVVSRSADADVGDSFFTCMSWVADYDEEWMTFVQEHQSAKRPIREDEIESEAPPRVWNFPHE
jgi:hypothetical protein